MITKEEFIQELNNISYTNEELVERYIWFGTPAVFSDCEQTYYDLKREISTQFPVKSKNNIIVVGSAKLGFSIAPRKRFRDIQDESDIDVAIIDEELFDSYWERLFEFNINVKSRSEKDDDLYRKFLQYFFKGWLRPDLFPFNFTGKREWFDFFSGISYKKYDKRKVAAAIYKNEYFFKKYHEENIKALREELKNEKI
jgi:hypothetical protein